MIHELIDPKKKAVRNGTARSTKLFNGVKTLSDNHTLDQSDGEHKDTESTSTTFIPPWLRNSLGLNQRNNQSHVVSDQKSTKTISKFKEQNQNELETLKENLEEHPGSQMNDASESVVKNTKKETIPSKREGCQTALNIAYKKSSTNYCNAKRRVHEAETARTFIDIEGAEKEKILISNTDGKEFIEIGKMKEDEKKKMKLLKQKNKIRRKSNVIRKEDLEKSKVDFLLEMKAREVLDDYVKKNIHSVSSDIKQLEAKLILLSAKCHEGINSKLSQEEMRLLQETINQAGNQEHFEKLMTRIKESNLKEIIRCPDSTAKSINDKPKKYEEKEKIKKQNLRNDGTKLNPDRNYLPSTDDETDTKRLGTLLSNNKNSEEKRKCLEEIRDYFERKRQYQLAKGRHAEDLKTSSQVRMVDKKDDFSKTRPKIKEIFTIMTNKDKTNKFEICDDEVVEKAVNETLQKFVNLYHFHVSPTVMGTMRKNILQAIQSDSFDSNHSAQNLPPTCDTEEVSDDKQMTKNSDVKIDLISGTKNEKKCQLNNSCTSLENTNTKETPAPPNYDGEEKHSSRGDDELLDETSHIGDEDPDGANFFKGFLKEFESFLSSVQSHPEIRSLKLQSITLEQEEQEYSDRLKLVYNFANKTLEAKKIVTDIDKSSENVSEENRKKSLENHVTTKRNVKSQTTTDLGKLEQSLQTEEKTCVTSGVQTDTEWAEEKQVKGGFEVSPEFCRVVESSKIKRPFFLPEKTEEQLFTVNCDWPLFKLFNPKVKNGRNKALIKDLAKIRTAKEKRLFFKNKERGRSGNKRTYIVSSKQMRTYSERKIFNAEQIENLKNCMDLAKLTTNAMKSFSEEGNLFAEDVGLKDVQKGFGENHLGCVWFWNGERITPGCDLKNHVEILLEEKLKKISGGELLKKIDVDEKKDVSSYDVPEIQEQNSEKNVQTRNGDTLLCHLREKEDSSTEANSVPFSTETSFSRFKKDTQKDESEVICEEQKGRTLLNDSDSSHKRRVDAENIQQNHLSPNLKSKWRMKNFAASGISRNKTKRKSIFGKPGRKKEAALWNLKKLANVMKPVKDFEDIESEIGDCGDKPRNIFETSSVSEKVTSLSDFNNGIKNPFGFPVDVKNKKEWTEIDKFNGKDKIKEKVIPAERKISTDAAETEEEENSSGIQERESGLVPVTDNQKHWELIESVINRVNRKERESLWNDIRQLIKMKIGRDINDEGAQEVCIEIEQDLPKTIQGKESPSILAKGHYVRNEGDVEVEIDLTLNDLERILRRRQRKIRKRELSRTAATRRVHSSSSELSEFGKDELHKCRRSLRKLSAIGEGSVTENDLKMLYKNKDKKY